MPNSPGGKKKTKLSRPFFSQNLSPNPSSPKGCSTAINCPESNKGLRVFFHKETFWAAVGGGLQSLGSLRQWNQAVGLRGPGSSLQQGPGDLGRQRCQERAQLPLSPAFEEGWPMMDGLGISCWVLLCAGCCVHPPINLWGGSCIIPISQIWKLRLQEVKCVLVTQSCPIVCNPMDCSLPGSMGFSREYWNGLPFRSPGDLPDPGVKPGLDLLHCRQILYCLSHQKWRDLLECLQPGSEGAGIWIQVCPPPNFAFHKTDSLPANTPHQGNLREAGRAQRKSKSDALALRGWPCQSSSSFLSFEPNPRWPPHCLFASPTKATVPSSLLQPTETKSKFPLPSQPKLRNESSETQEQFFYCTLEK